jgi:hypothetical protein
VSGTTTSRSSPTKRSTRLSHARQRSRRRQSSMLHGQWATSMATSRAPTRQGHRRRR